MATDYKFTDVYMFSDEEGGAPFLFGKDPEGSVLEKPNKSNSDKADEGIPTELMGKFTFSETGLLTGINGDTGLVFLGDLVDNEPYSIRVLKAMCDLKDAKPNQVLLIGGNRDFNKIRLGFEFYMTKSDGSLPWTGANTFQDMVSNLNTDGWTFRETAVPSYIKNAKLGAWNGQMGVIEGSITSGDIDNRVATIYAKTLGIFPGTAPLRKELNEMFSNPGITDQNFSKVVCAVHMLMTFKWDDLKGNLNELNGLYLKYLERCHALALFEIDGKYGVVSHGGMPVPYLVEKEVDNSANPGKKIKTSVRVEKTLTSPFGYLPGQAGFGPGSLKELILALEAEKANLITSVKSLRDTGVSNRAGKEAAYNSISKFVHLTALTNLPKGANAFSSPIVGFQFIPIQMRTGNIKVNLEGGSLNWINANLAKTNKKQLSAGDTIISYDIFGHMPQGFVPTAYREEGTTTLHVNLDVSKIDGQANNYSFAMLHLQSGQEPEFIGRFKVQPAKEKVHTYMGNTAKYIEKVVYYRIKIPSTGAVSMLKNIENASRFTEKLPIKVSNPEKSFERVYNKRGGYHKGRKHTRKAKKSHKKRGTRKH